MRLNNMTKTFALWAVIIAALLLGLVSANAHNKSLSFSEWLWQGRVVDITFTAPSRDVTLLPIVQTAPSLEAALNMHLNTAFIVEQNDTKCQLQQAFSTHAAAAGYISARARFLCFSESNPISITSHAFFNYAATHVHFARLRLDAKTPASDEVLFTATNRRFTLRKGEDGAVVKQGGNIFFSYIGLGISHIATGLDHIAFLMCLLLLARGRGQVLLLISGFTLGHSITLALAALDIATPHNATVEAIIGLSIAVVAAETILARRGLMPLTGLVLLVLFFGFSGFAAFGGGNLPLAAWAGLMLFCLCYGLLIRDDATAQRLAPLLTALFGLFHGFGFGGLLLDIGLPRGQVLPALLGFNVGVELGQVAIVIALGVFAAKIVPLLRDTFPVPSVIADMPLRGRDIMACVLTAYGVFLFIQRSLL